MDPKFKYLNMRPNFQYVEPLLQLVPAIFEKLDAWL